MDCGHCGIPRSRTVNRISVDFICKMRSGRERRWSPVPQWPARRTTARGLQVRERARWPRDARGEQRPQRPSSSSEGRPEWVTAPGEARPPRLARTLLDSHLWRILCAANCFAWRRQGLQGPGIGTAAIPRNAAAIRDLNKTRYATKWLSSHWPCIWQCSR